MKYPSPAEKILIQEISQASERVRVAARGLSIGSLIKVIRKQLGMSQRVLAERAGVPQSTISRLEKGDRDTTLFMLNKILNAASCELILAPRLLEPIEVIKRKQARKIAQKQVSYLQGTMNLENQQPDKRFMEELMKEEETRILYGPKTNLWKEHEI